jgi:hypothetical protein
MFSELVQKTDLKRKKGKLYYIDLDGDICESVMGAIIGRDKSGKPIYATPDKVLKLAIIREEGFLYIVGEDGNIYRSKKPEE